MLGYRTDPDWNVNIDDLDDWARAERLLATDRLACRLGRDLIQAFPSIVEMHRATSRSAYHHGSVTIAGLAGSSQ
jgi:hypothetical protein